jgi:hypothetical protein
MAYSRVNFTFTFTDGFYNEDYYAAGILNSVLHL